MRSRGASWGSCTPIRTIKNPDVIKSRVHGERGVEEVAKEKTKGRVTVGRGRNDPVTRGENSEYRQR